MLELLAVAVHRAKLTQLVGRVIRPCGSNLMHRPCLSFVAILFFVRLSCAWQTLPTPPMPEKTLVELEKYRLEVSAGAQTVAHTIDRLLAVGRCPFPSPIPNDATYVYSYVESGTAVQIWARRNSPDGRLSGRLFVEPSKVLQRWEEALKDGSDPYVPMETLRLMMTWWRAAKDRLNRRLEQTIRPEGLRYAEDCRSGILHLSGKEKQQSTERIQELERMIAENLLAAQTELYAVPPFPDPVLASERSTSPFTGPVNPSPPDRLWIWTNKSSTVIDGTINVAIGLGNKAGPNCVADKSYSIRTSCDGCKIKQEASDLRIEKGERAVKTSVQVKAARAFLNATAEGAQPGQANLKGCFIAENLVLHVDKPQSAGRADGVTPIPFTLVFENGSKPTTNLQEKTILLSVNGGAVAPLIAQTGSIRAFPPAVVPSDECEIKLGVTSPVVVHSRVEARYGNQLADPVPEFDFTYVLNWADFLALAVAILLGAATKDAFWRRRRYIQWWLAVLASCTGGITAFAVIYFKEVERHPQTDAWLLFGGLSLIGSSLGVAGLKSLMPILAPAPNGGEPPG